MIYYLIFIALFIGVLVFISSRIRKFANTAFEPEIIETEEFKISKPEGYLHPLNNDSGLPFEAYSREYGEKGAGRFRKSLVKMSTSEGLKMKEMRRSIKENLDSVNSETFVENAPQDQKICLIEGAKTEDKMQKLFFHKIVESKSRNKTYNLEVSVLESNEDEYLKRISDLINNFTVN